MTTNCINSYGCNVRAGLESGENDVVVLCGWLANLSSSVLCIACAVIGVITHSSLQDVLV